MCPKVRGCQGSTGVFNLNMQAWETTWARTCFFGYQRSFIETVICNKLDAEQFTCTAIPQPQSCQVALISS